MSLKRPSAFWLSLLILIRFLPAACGAELIDFNRQVRTILSDNCLACHGFDENSREADLRLDTFEGATADLGGYAAIVPGKPGESQLIQRISTSDLDSLMPPPESHKKPLDSRSISILKEWIRQGAPWGKHWAFERPSKETIPQTGIHPIDYFVRRRLRTAQLQPAPRAEVHTLVRRLSFDLTGLPPSQDDLKKVGPGQSLEVWEEFIESLLQSPHYGERMAMWWLDGARYSDTDGFQQDGTRTNWPWRDWVVDAFNRNLPFDQFTLEQFAGDLLPDATPEQRMATCFHRNHMNNGEGGRDPAESRVDYVLDRVNTSGTLWLGLTLGCTQCHDHKFDPISQQDYYRFAAYFNSIDETGAAGSKAGPYMKYRSPHAQRTVDEASRLLEESDAALSAITGQAEAEFNAWLRDQFEQTPADYQPWELVRPKQLATTEGSQLNLEAGQFIVSQRSELPQDDYVITAMPTSLERVTGIKLDVYPDSSHTDGKYSFSDSGEFILTNIKLRLRKQGSSQYREIELAAAAADMEGAGEDTKYGKVSGTLDDDPRTGWTTRTKPADVAHHAVFALAEPLTVAADEELDIILMQRSLAPRELLGRFQLSVTDQPGAAVRSLETMPLEELAAWKGERADAKQPDLAGMDGKLRKRLFEQFLEDYLPWQNEKRRNDRVRSQLAAAKQAAGQLNVMVLAEREEPRATYVLQRGVWDDHGEQVQPGVLPAVLARDAETVPTRLELGRWIVAPENPLTARVIVNQVWQLFFGAGLVRTPNDFGLQGEPPTHPQLLDWLAADFMESGWDLKHLVRTIVTSETYQQSSRVDARLRAIDPENRLLARGSRFRLPSWMIRDALLKSSGLLHDVLGGPPVFPYQPPGVWKDQFMGRFEYTPTVGPQQYRRTLYAFWRRSSAPTFLFDSATRRRCEVVTRRTNTPLHALTLLNDLTSLEAARTLAVSVAEAAPEDLDRQMVLLCRRVLSREPQPTELAVFLSKRADAIDFFEANPEQARKFTHVGQLSPPSGDVPQLAAMTFVANMVLNLDESITHE